VSTSFLPPGLALLGIVVIIFCLVPPPLLPPASASLLQKCQNNLPSVKVRLHLNADLLGADNTVQKTPILSVSAVHGKKTRSSPNPAAQSSYFFNGLW
jgi:hypothetical protein